MVSVSMCALGRRVENYKLVHGVRVASGDQGACNASEWSMLAICAINVYLLDLRCKSLLGSNPARTSQALQLLSYSTKGTKEYPCQWSDFLTVPYKLLR